jgi:magnesium chelatase family protein
VLVRTHCFCVQRGIAEHVQVELDVRRGLPSFSVVGLAGAAARDARERVQAALVNTGVPLPRQRLTVNLAPSSARRTGSEFDLAIACCVLAAQGHLDSARLARVALFGELGLGGQLRRCPGVALAASAAADAELAGLIVASGDTAEARSAGGLPVAGAADLGEVLALLAPPGARERPGTVRRGTPPGPRA